MDITTLAEHDLSPVPEEGRWGQGYGRAYTPAELDDIAVNVAPVRGPGHPPRLLADNPGFSWGSAGPVRVPAGLRPARSPQPRRR